MYWRIGAQYQKRARERNKKAFHAIVKRGPPPGLLAFEGRLAVGWCQLTRPDTLPWLNRMRSFNNVDDDAVLSLTCFFVRRGFRRQRVMETLIKSAIKVAKRSGAQALEAYPIDTSAPKSTANVFTGVASTFARLGFKTVARRLPYRPIVRYDLRSIR